MNAVEGALEIRRKISYSIVGLFVGDVTMLILFSLIFQAWEQSPAYLVQACFLAITCSFLGWAVVGLPAVLLVNTAFVVKLKWYLEVLVGALLGSVAVVVIFKIYGHSLPTQSWGYTYFWIFATLVSTVAFSIYCGLVRKAIRQEETNKASGAKDEPAPILRPLTRVDIDHPELSLDIYNSDWLDTLEPSDPRRSTSGSTRPPGSKAS